MNRLEAHCLFCRLTDGGLSLLPQGCDAEVAPLFCTALAGLSGRLGTCESIADLQEAVAFGFSLLRIGTATDDDWHNEVEETRNIVMKDAEKFFAEMN